MKYFTFIAIVLLSLPSAAAIAGEVVWTSTRVATQDGILPPDDSTPQPGLSISSDEGHIEYEALEPLAEKPQRPEPISAARMQGRKPMISIVIDDMGMDRQHTARALKLPPQVALSYLPYSPDIRQQTGDAFAAGHELILHLPMQPQRKTANPGPDYLGADMPPLELLERVNKNLSAFHGYVGVNNHMGSKFTKDRDGLNVVMSAIAEKNLMFLDSLTVQGSLAEKVAKEHGIQATHRDVFLDDDTTATAVAKSLAEIEAVARHSGTAIAIGHPKDVTLAALEKWLPTLRAKGFELVPLTQVIALRNVEKVAEQGLGALPPLTAATPVETAVETPASLPSAAPIVAETTEPIVVAVPGPVAAKAPVVHIIPPAAQKSDTKPYADSLAKVEAKAKEWEEHKSP